MRSPGFARKRIGYGSLDLRAGELATSPLICAQSGLKALALI